MTSFTKPTSELVAAAVAKLSAPQHERYFFDHLKNPHWITPLSEHGLFKEPPALIQVEGGGFRCPSWSQSRYLARMAALAPDEVAAILEKIQTDNWVVAYDILNAAKAMPASIAQRLVDVIGVTLRHGMVSHLIIDVGELIASLVAGGQPSAALRLAQNVFAIEDSNLNASCRRYDENLYCDSLIEHVVPNLAVARPSEFISLFLDWMNHALKESGSERESDRTSFIWRPAIEDHEQNRDFTFSAKMVGILRTACETAIRSGKVSLDDVLEMTYSHSGQVISRLRVHLIAEFAEQNTTLARKTIATREVFYNTWIKHEYSRLVGLRWQLLSSSEQEQWLSWVDEGPEDIDNDNCKEAGDEDINIKHLNYWKFQRLFWIRDHLVGERRSFFNVMLSEYGAPKLADLNVYNSGVHWFEHISPMSSTDLVNMGFMHAVKVITNWRPEPANQGYDEPNVEGLSREFQKLIELDPLEASKEASVMMESRPIFVRTFLQAMERAIKDGKEISLRPVMELARWVVERPAEETDTTPCSAGLIDRDWKWSRDTVASLVEEIAAARDSTGSMRYHLDHRKELWELVHTLPSFPPCEYIMRERSEDPREVDWLTVMLNSNRGKAMRAVFAYVDWLASHLSLGDRSRGSLEDGFNTMPEVRELLEYQLVRPDIDCAGHAAFGSRLGLIAWIDSSWVESNIGRIFDLRVLETNPDRAFGWAAWSVFLFTHKPGIKFYNLLRDQFCYAVDQSSQIRGDKREAQVWSRLGEHLIVLFGSGEFGLSGSDGLRANRGIISKLVTQTHVSVRSHAIQFVGHSLSGLTDSLPRDIISRLEDLWDYYWESVGRSDAESTPQSSVFGYWFCSGVFESGWSIERLLYFVTAAPGAEPDELIVEQLAKICRRDPLRASQIIQTFVLADKEGWRVSGWLSSAKEVLKVSMLAGGDAKVVASSVIDRLGRRGFSEFGELLAFYTKEFLH
jgi:hypothetical protein